MRLVAVVQLAMLLLCSNLSFAGEDVATSQPWKDLWAQGDPAASPKFIDAVLKACGGKADAVKALIASDAAYADYKSGWLKRTTSVADDKKTYEVEYFVRVPKGYSPDKAWPVIVGAHGQLDDGKGFGHMLEELLGQDVDQYVLVVPTMPGEKDYNARPYQEQTYLLPLAWTRMNLHVDPDRVFITGYSQGGRVSWHMATMWPQIWAAAIPMAGVQWFEGGTFTMYSYLENVAAVPMWQIWGDKDTVPAPNVGNVEVCRETLERMKKLGNENFTGTEIKGAGHENTWPNLAEFRKYLQTRKRPALPEKFTHCFHLASHAWAYYVEATKFVWPPIVFDKTLKVELPAVGGKPPTTQAFADAMQRKVNQSMFRFAAQLDHKANSLTIDAPAVTAVRVYVMDGLFDLSKPVTIVFRGRTWKGTVVPSGECLLRSYLADRDASRLVLNEIEVTSAGAGAVKFK